MRFYVFSGLAISSDGGEHFERSSQVPILDRTDDELLFRVIHSVIHENGTWRAWYGGGSHFQAGNQKSLPVYDIRYLESEDGYNFSRKGKVVLPIDRVNNEHRVGRPYVIKHDGVYQMYFGGGTEATTYRLAFAESKDGIHWKRDDARLSFRPSGTGWDSEMMGYPAVISVGDETYMFYNGNRYGYDGFGCAVLR